eukprot:Cvel_31920.t2-p1 / transcript=Cvel_31920.t2 / gene=Cvel_31920 / organism=Chromera_velia_CCMP2878 / gene_product=hypothetical protein / transcript_product=hypothetical protein / location=Cvel_scaffold4850:2458-3351(-) / protein_length=298 / sequence_SO=supercontig / SO=protein_coding / is_pseudo=false
MKASRESWGESKVGVKEQTQQQKEEQAEVEGDKQQANEMDEGLHSSACRSLSQGEGLEARCNSEVSAAAISILQEESVMKASARATTTAPSVSLLPSAEKAVLRKEESQGGAHDGVSCRASRTDERGGVQKGRKGKELQCPSSFEESCLNSTSLLSQGAREREGGVGGESEGSTEGVLLLRPLKAGVRGPTETVESDGEAQPYREGQEDSVPLSTRQEAPAVDDAEGKLMHHSIHIEGPTYTQSKGSGPETGRRGDTNKVRREWTRESLARMRRLSAGGQPLSFSMSTREEDEVLVRE